MTTFCQQNEIGPVFIVGMNGSGTTMMLDHLGNHPRLFGFKLETYILPHYLLNEKAYGDLRKDENFRRLWDRMRKEFAFCYMNKGRSVDLPSDWRVVPRSVAGVFERIMRGFAQQESKARWCEKTPMYALHLPAIAAAFPDARFIHMIRDGRSCAISNQRRWGKHPANTTYRWKHVVAEAQKQGEKLGERYLEVRYEDLTNDAEQYMRRICEFVGIPFDERVLLASRPRTMTGQKAKTIVRNQGRSRDHLSASTIDLLERIAGRRLASLGYPAKFPDDDFDPARVRILWWTVHDAAIVLTRRLRNKFASQRQMSWSLFWSRLMTMARHARSSALRSITGRHD